MKMKEASVHDLIRNRILRDVENKDNKPLSLESLRKTEWSPLFEELMRNRQILGAFRYQTYNENRIDGGKYKRVDSIIKRANMYAETHNMELLVDIANLCMLEYEFGDHPDRHFKSIDDGEHVEER